MRKLLSLILCCALCSTIMAAPRRKSEKTANFAESQTTEKIRVAHLRVEGLENPLGLDLESPRFSWQLESEINDVLQSSFQILVASHPDTLKQDRGDLWDCTIQDGKSVLIPYAGKALKPNQRGFWKVRVITNHGKTRWSEPAEFGIGLMTEGRWRGRWIGYDHAFPWDEETTHSRLSARYLRKEFNVKKEVARATLHICGLGLYEAHINGKQVGNQVLLAPAPTDYRKTIIYNTYDVTSLLQADGKQDNNNCIAVTLAPGRFYTMRQNYKPYKITNFGYPKLRANLIIEYADGSKQNLDTDTSWKLTAGGPIRSANDYDGEIYDAQREELMSGWMLPGYNDDFWLDAERVSIPSGTLVGNLTPSMVITDYVPARTLTPMGENPEDEMPVGKGRYIIDFGQNFAGWMRINIEGKGAKGDTIRLRFAERLQENGELYTENLRDAQVTDYYICSGSDKGTWAPRFTTHGFRYAEVTNYPAARIEDFSGEAVGDPMEQTGEFECAHPMLNQIVKNARWGIKSNYKGMPVDCPQRNERMPWLGDRAMGCWGESYLMDNAALYAKWLDDIADSQRADGVIPDVAPAYWNYYTDDVTWPSVYIFAADMLYKQFGDINPIKKHYDRMKRWLVHFESAKMNADGLVYADKYGDWCVAPESPELIHSQDPDRKTDGTLIASAYYYKLMQIMIEFGTLLQAEASTSALQAEAYKQDQAYWTEACNKIKEAFNKKYLNVKTGTSPAPEHILYPDSIYYSNNSVTSNLLPLAFGMVPEEYASSIERQIIKKIILKPADGHLCCGVIGIQWLMRELSRMGRTDVAYLLATIKTYPSWGYMVENGATTIWELWNGDTANPKMNSGNHIMLLGDLLPWCFENIGGIRAAEPAYKKIILAPNFELQELSSANVSYKTPYGKVVSNWKKTNHQLDWEIQIPANTTATVILPANVVTDDAAVKKSKKRKKKSAPAQHILTLTSGKHKLSYRLNPAISARPEVAFSANDSIATDRALILKDEFLYETASFPSCHSASLCELPNGDILATYFGGAREGAPDVCIWTSRKRKLQDGSMQEGWEAPVLVADGILNDTLRKACYNPVLFQVPDGELILFYKIGRNVKDWTGYIKRSKDNGYTWGERENIVSADPNLPADSLLGAIKNKPEIIDGKILAPSSKEFGGWRCYVEVSEDMGKTWSLIGPVPQIADKDFKTIQPFILKHKDGRLQMLARTQKSKLIATTFSNDRGKTWSEMQLIEGLPNNNSGIDGVTAPDGTHYMVYNPFGIVPGPDKPLRNPLCVAKSQDGIHWTHIATLEDSPISQYSYPCMILSQDGKTLHIAYTWRRQRMKYIQLKIAD